MTPPLRALLTCAFALGLAAPLRADDAPRDILLKSQRAQLAAPTCRMTIVSTDVQAGKSGVTVIETVGLDLTHLRQVRDGKLMLELIGDGKKTLVRREEDASFTAAPDNAAAMMAGLRRSSSLQAMAAGASDLKIAGHETIQGQPATIYASTTDGLGVHVVSKIWIADKDSLPLKAEGRSTGEVNTGSGIPQQTNQHSEITYSYDPAITITLPES